MAVSIPAIITIAGIKACQLLSGPSILIILLIDWTIKNTPAAIAPIPIPTLSDLPRPGMFPNADRTNKTAVIPPTIAIAVPILVWSIWVMA